MNWANEYDALHEAIGLLNQAWWTTDDYESRQKILRIMDYLRVNALALMPWAACNQHKGASDV